jgi:antitoxin component of RelBE/YafQ-DinJ toxin-antitoxin module
MSKQPLTDRIDTRIDAKRKQQYRDHAMKKHGLRLGDWVRMLMHRDFSSDK